MSAVECKVRTVPTTLRRLPIGAEVLPGDATSFRVWAPKRRSVEVVLSSKLFDEQPATRSLEAEGNGYFSAVVESLAPGSLYHFCLDGDPQRFPDPASRYQPEGPFGPSQLVDPEAFSWSDHDWKGVSRRGQVIYEMHVGTFTPEGTWQAALNHLEELADLGITVIEVMPLADFPGRFGWGYDGVNLFAPTRLYGTPDDFRRFVDEAHRRQLGVILDVVYNHFGPDGNFMAQFSDTYTTRERSTDWGEAINFDADGSEPVREYFLSNAIYWITEFHLDGLRLDATQDIHDSSPEHIIAAVTRSVRETAGSRSVIVVAENEPQDTQLIQPVDEEGFGLDAAWNDDFHHSAMVQLTGHNEAYYTDYLGRSQEFISALKRGYLYQGQWYSWQKKGRGTSCAGLAPESFITFIQNHDQLANSGRGLRVHELTSPGRLKAMTALLLLGPNTPMLFQGQEFAASNPFFYFADHSELLSKRVFEGRKSFMAQFRSIAQPDIQACLPDPADPATFIRSKLNPEERIQHREIYELHRDLLRLRREDPVLSQYGRDGFDGAVLNDDAFVIRFFAPHCNDRLLAINFGRDLPLVPLPEPLLAPPFGKTWQIVWSTEEPKYGGVGTPPFQSADVWVMPGNAAVLLAPVDCSPDDKEVEK